MANKKFKTRQDLPQDLFQVASDGGGSQKGLVTVSLASLLPLLENKKSGGKDLGHFVSSLHIQAETQEDCIRAELNFKLEVLKDELATIQLAPGNVAVNDARVRIDVQDETEASLVFENSYHTLLVKQAGNYSVTLHCLCPYNNKSKTGFDLGFPECSRTTIDFTVVGREDVQVTVDPALNSTMRCEDGSTFAHIVLPPTSNASIRWTEVMHNEQNTAIAEAVQPLSATAQQSILFSVGEGMLLVDGSFDYDIRNGTMSVFDVQLDPRIRVLSVEGQNVKRWDVIQNTVQADAFGDDEKGQEQDEVQGVFTRVLRVSLDHGVEGSYQLAFSAEMELHSTTSTFEAPVFSHISSVFTREKGFIGVEARTNVEVDQHESCVGCLPIDVDEIPLAVKQNASSPLLLAYKYLLVPFTLKLAVKKHGEVDVLIASIDAAHFSYTKTEEGKVMHKLVLKMRNTQKQYVRIGLKEDCEIWSTVVSGQAVKPARDKVTNAVMVPLPKSLSKERNHATFTAELVWILNPDSEKDLEKMGDAGHLSFYIPKVDIPMNTVYLTTYLPKEYDYGEFTGDMKEVKNFSGAVPQATDVNAAPPAAPQQMLMSNLAQVRMDSCSDGSDTEEEWDHYASKSVKKSKKTFSIAPAGAHNAARRRNWGGKAGVVPVRVNVVTSGIQFKFERLVVMNQDMEISVEYLRKKEDSRKKRSLRPKKKGFFSCCK